MYAFFFFFFFATFLAAFWAAALTRKTLKIGFILFFFSCLSLDQTPR